jgi:hypothetical protein
MHEKKETHPAAAGRAKIVAALKIRSMISNEFADDLTATAPAYADA